MTKAQTRAKKGDQVSILITGKNPTGFTFLGGEEEKLDPLTITIGEEQILPAIEEAVIGMEAGQTKTIDVPPEHAFGPHYEDRMLTLKKSEFPPDLELEVDNWYAIEDPDGGDQTSTARIVSIEKDQVTLDTNHPLAGTVVTFEITLVQII